MYYMLYIIQLSNGRMESLYTQYFQNFYLLSLNSIYQTKHTNIEIIDGWSGHLFRPKEGLGFWWYNEDDDTMQRVLMNRTNELNW